MRVISDTPMFNAPAIGVSRQPRRLRPPARIRTAAQSERKCQAKIARQTELMHLKVLGMRLDRLR